MSHDETMITSPDGTQEWNGAAWVPVPGAVLPAVARLALNKNLGGLVLSTAATIFFYLLAALVMPAFMLLVLPSFIACVLFGFRLVTYKSCPACRSNVPVRALVCPTCRQPA